MESRGDRENIMAHLERIFSRFPFSDPFTGITDDQEVILLGIGYRYLPSFCPLSISFLSPSIDFILTIRVDDIDLDEPAPVTSSHKSESKGKG